MHDMAWRTENLALQPSQVSGRSVGRRPYLMLIASRNSCILRVVSLYDEGCTVNQAPVDLARLISRVLNSSMG